MAPPIPSYADLQAEVHQLRARVAELEAERHPAATPAERSDPGSLAQAKAEAAATRLRLDAALASMSDAVFIADVDGRFVHTNEAFATYHRFRNKEECSKKIGECPGLLTAFLPDGTEAPPEMWAVPRALRGETATDFEYTLKRKDTGETWVGSYSFGPIRGEDGATIGAVVVARDITEHRRAQQQLIRNQQTFSELVERAPFGIYIVDSGFRIAHMNAGSQTGAFRNVRPLIGRDFAEVMRILWPEAVAEEITGHFRHTLETGEPYYSPRFVNPRHDLGTVESYEWELHRMTLPDGRYGVICYYFDSTALRQAEETLRQFNQQLEQRVAERTAELIEAGAKVHSERQRFLDMLDTLPVIVDIIRADYRVEWTNRAYREALGDNAGGLCHESQFGRREPCEECQAFVPLQTGRPHHWEWALPSGRTYDIYNFPFAAADGSPAVLEMDIDVTDLRQAEAELKDLNATLEQRVSERTAELEAVLNSLHNGVFVCDAAGRVIRSNPAARVFYGIDVTGAAEIGSAGVSIRRLDGSEMPTDELPSRRALRGERVVDEEYLFTRKDGAERVGEASATPLIVNGKTVGVAVIARDITERKQALEELERMRSLLAEGQRIAHLGTFEYVSDTRTTVWSEEEYRIYGLDPAGPSPAYDVLLSKCIHPDDAGLLHHVFTAAMESRSIYELEHRIVRPDGSVRWVYDRAHPHFDESGKLVRYVGATLDITGRKQAEEALRASEERFQLSMEATSDGLWDWNAETDEVYFSPTYYRILGYEQDGFPGNIVAWKERIHPEDLERVIRVNYDCVAGRTESFTVEYRMRTRDGGWRWILGRGKCIARDGRGRATRLIGTHVDITERKQAEAALRESEARFRLALKNAPVSVAAQDLDLRYIWAYNQRSTTPDQIVGHFDQEIFTAEEAAHFTEMKRRVLETGIELREQRWLDRPAGRMYLDITWEPIRDQANRIIGVASATVDLTPIKLAEEALRRSEARWNAAIESFAEGAIIATEDEQVVYWNPAARAMHGFTAPGEGIEPLEKTPITFQLWTPDSRHMLELDEWPMRRIKRGETVRDLELRVRRPDQGWEKIFSYSGAMVATAGGERLIFLTCRDLTEQRKAEAALRESEERLRLAQDAAGIGSFEWNIQAGVNTWTPRLEQMYGLLPGAFERTQPAWEDLVHPEDRARASERVKQSFETGAPTEAEWRVVWPDGSVHWLSGRWQVFKDAGGTPLRMTGVNIDITERKHAEEVLAGAMQRLSAHMDNSPLAIIEFDPQFRVTRWSKEAAKLFGWTAEEILGRAIAELRWVHEEDAETVRQISEDMLTGKRPRNAGVNRNYRKDGSVMECEWYNSAIYNSDGSLSSILSQVLDVTARKRDEAALREKQKLESLGLLAGGVAHDFNNLLVGVLGNASLAQEMLPPDHPAAELMESVVKTGEKAAHLTRQMLAYAGKGKFLLESLDISALVHDMIGLVRPSIPKKVAVSLDLGKDLPPIEADRGQVQQILMNLAINAAEAIGSHDGQITVRTGTQVVDAEYVRRHRDAVDLEPGTYVALEVHDTGCGMDEAVRARIFDPFFSTKFTGRGLGLAAVAGIVRGHKGAIIVTSAPGKGSTFSVLLPPALSPATTKADVLPEAIARGCGVILIVDDEEVVLDMGQRALVRGGYTVLTADSGTAAIDVLSRHPGDIDLVVLDLSMPGMSGEETLPGLRRIRPEVKVLVSSGYSETEAMTVFKGQRVSGFIQKPYTAAGLAERVARVLE